MAGDFFDIETAEDKSYLSIRRTASYDARVTTYRVAFVGDDPVFYKDLETVCVTYMPQLITLVGPLSEVPREAMTLDLDATISVEESSSHDDPRWLIRINPTPGGSADRNEIILELDSLRPVQVLAGVLAVLEGIEIRIPSVNRPLEGGTLTPREIDVLRYVSGGYNNREIAGYLGITERTVKYHISEILSKLDVSGRTEAVVEAARLGVIPL